MNIGIDIGGSHIAVGLIDNTMNIVSKKEHNWTENEKSDLLNSVVQYSKQLVKELMEEA